MNNKKCGKCKKVKKHDDFYSYKDGRLTSHCKLCMRGYAKANRQRKVDYDKIYRKENKEKIKKWREDNKELIRSYWRNAKNQVMDYYGGRCNCCEENDIRFLTIDHINNDGAERRKNGEPKGGTFYNWIIKNGFPDDLQIICYNCNYGKNGNGGICPHKIDEDNVMFIPYKSLEQRIGWATHCSSPRHIVRADCMKCGNYEAFFVDITGLHKNDVSEMIYKCDGCNWEGQIKLGGIKLISKHF